MKCRVCGTESPEGMKFCGACGASLAVACSKCGAEVPDGFRFCGHCGHALAAAPTPPPAPAPAPAPGGAERRQLTVMFCDLVDSTSLAERLDPEVYRDVVRRYQDACGGAIEAYAGYVAQYLGDGVLVYFGYPQAHEDDARRAVHSGLRICDALRDLNQVLERDLGLRLAVRIGIHTGPVVAGSVGTGERTEQLALGQTPNVAARLQTAAEPDTVVLSADTHKLVRPFFACRPLGRQVLRGTAIEIELYQALHERDPYHRFDLSRGSAVIGRDNELAVLLDRLERARRGQGQVVLLTGEAGIGKSRLAHWFREHSGFAPETSRLCTANAYSQTSALHPLVELVENLCRFERDDSPSAKLTKLKRFVETQRVDVEEAAPLLAELLSLPPDESWPALELTPQRKKEKTLDLLLALLLGPEGQGPSFVLLEDLHWIDPSTLELLDRLIERVPERRAFVLLTFRRQFEPPWPVQDHLTPVTLLRLTNPQVEEVIRGLTGGKTLPPEVLDQLIEKTDGVPLFVEELTKMILESGLLRERETSYEVTEPIPELAIPSTLQDSLMARLDRLSLVKQVAQLGAVLGREFSFEMIGAVSSLDEDILRRNLRQLVDAELLVHHDAPHDTYVFKHALIQDAAYESLLRSARAEHHQRIAGILVERFPEIAAARPELVAHHFTEAGQLEPAVRYWLQAGRTALARSANLEAIQSVHHGLAQLAKLPDSDARRRTELALQTTLAPALVAARGYSAPEVEKTYRRGVELGRRIGDDSELARLLWGLGVFYQGRGDLVRALEIGRQLMDRTGQEPALDLQARVLLGSTLFFLGRLDEARDCLENAYNESRELRDASTTGQDIGVTALMYTSMILWHLGETDRALDLCREAVTTARERAQPFTLSGVLTFAGFFFQFRKEVGEAEAMAREGIELAQEHGFPVWQAFGEVILGWVRSRLGSPREGAEMIRQALASYRETGTKVFQTYFMTLLAEAQGTAGDVSAGLATIKAATAAAEETGEKLWMSDLLRIEAELLSSVTGAGSTRA